MNNFDLKNEFKNTKLISVRIPEYVDQFIENTALNLGGYKSKSDFINEAIKTLCYATLSMINQGVDERIKIDFIDDDGVTHKINFKDYLEMFS